MVINKKSEVKMVFKKIDIHSFQGVVPENHDLVISEQGDEIPCAIWLSGFDEVGAFDHLFNSPVYGFIG
tara:strand:- start:5653 stop:5859 length:207 start_codon:yes stop_codon:yes gene_type:complete